MPSNYKVKVLFDGYSECSENIMKANCTSTLITGPHNIIVDTMTSWDGEKLRNAIKDEGLLCDDIDYVICTHGHSDHIGCNYLFRKAVHVVGYSISKHDEYTLHDFESEPEYRIDDKCKVVATPGHTLQDVSVIVETAEGTIAITGDLFEKEEDLVDSEIWKGAGSDSEKLQEENRERILSLADYVIPGHGPKFKNPFK